MLAVDGFVRYACCLFLWDLLGTSRRSEKKISFSWGHTGQNDAKKEVTNYSFLKLLTNFISLTKYSFIFPHRTDANPDKFSLRIGVPRPKTNDSPDTTSYYQIWQTTQPINPWFCLQQINR